MKKLKTILRAWCRVFWYCTVPAACVGFIASGYFTRLADHVRLSPDLGGRLVLVCAVALLLSLFYVADGVIDQGSD